MCRCRFVAAVPLLAMSMFAAPSYGQGVSVTTTRPILSGKQIASTKPRKNRLPRPDTSQVKAETSSLGAAPVVVQGSAEGTGASGILAYGSFGIPYTSTRVELGASNALEVGPNYLHTTFPYRASGKLTFTGTDGQDYHCSATLIRKSVVVTAAHCIQDFGTGNALNTNFQFTPGFYYTEAATPREQKPYGTWRGRYVVRPAAWANGSDVGDGSAVNNDVAVIILEKNSAGRVVGSYTGWLSYASNNYGFISSPKTGGLKVAATTTLGYPGLLDNGDIMQRVDGPSFLTTVSGAWQIWQGSDFTEGSSGGPWIVNFRSGLPVRSGGSRLGVAPVMAVIGVTSWGSPSPNEPKDNYSSQFRQNSAYPASDYNGYGAGNIGALVSLACRAPAGGGLTFAQRGYC